MSDPVKAEHTNYYDVGISHKLASNLTVTADAFYKQVANLLDALQNDQRSVVNQRGAAETATRIARRVTVRKPETFTAD